MQVLILDWLRPKQTTEANDYNHVNLNLYKRTTNTPSRIKIETNYIA